MLTHLSGGARSHPERLSWLLALARQQASPRELATKSPKRTLPGRLDLLLLFYPVGNLPDREKPQARA